MRQFKPGDKVLFLGELNEYVTHGKIYTVDEPCHDAFNDPNWICIVNDDKGGHQGFSLVFYKFELYEIATPKTETGWLDRIQLNFK